MMTEPAAAASWVDAVQTFWFKELEPAAWFEANPDIDNSVRARFLTIHERVAADFDSETAMPSSEQAVATVILFDQFPRNMFRGTPRAFGTDHLALAVARKAIDRRLDDGLDANHRLFLYLPFEHSEDMSDQHRAVEFIGKFDSGERLQFAVAHRDIIARFGRFPHRNATLGRQSTPEEIAFLQQPGHSC